MAEMPDGRKRCIECRTADGIDDEIESFAVRQFVDVLFDAARRVVNRRCAESRDDIVIARACRREDACAERVRKLNRYMPDTARSALHEHGLTGPQMRAVDDARVRRDERERQRGGFAHRQIGRLVGEQLRIDGRVLSERTLDAADAPRHPIHLVARLERGDVRAGRDDHTREIDAEHERQRMARMSRVARADLRVERIQTACVDPHQHLAARGFGNGQRRQFEWTVVLVEHEGLHGHDGLLPLDEFC
jgi:hypothetical protein